MPRSKWQYFNGGGETIARLNTKSFDYDIPSIPAFGFQQFNIAKGHFLVYRLLTNFIINPFGTHRTFDCLP